MKIAKLIVVIVTVVVLAGMYLVLRPEPASDNGTKLSQETSKALMFDLVLVDGKLSSGESTIKVKQNETVTIKVSANTKDELHLHGYDKSFELEPDKSAVLSFKANRAGRFEAELHSNETAVFVFEVQLE